ncbi:ribosomal protein S16 [Nadsonia fulvescens var. elongata DSM 6958]|uniref:Ribosomal protein S16 n=1 Tax=Nadsonia fulvescens var. elongata DSM 6958 TaxID=857566 RepID=A0A1E3PNJ9_9ASCO|nr:ribosomal protein S16 [Nadsonia fulvescens var. elongata DSM 6958]
MVNGPVRIRLARFGRAGRPLYNIVVTNSWKTPKQMPIEVLGTYNPIPLPQTPEEVKAGIAKTKQIEMDFDRIKYWIGVGAQPTERVGWLLEKAGILTKGWATKASTAPTKGTK